MEKTLMADSGIALKKHLEEQGNFVLDIRRAEGGGRFFTNFRSRIRLNSRDFFSFNQEFSVLIRAGLPIVGALDAITEKEEAKETELNRLLKKIRADISTGESLSGAFGKYTHIFSKLYVASLKAGEKSGDITTAISRYIDYMKKVAEIRQKVVAASVYPIILTGVSVFTLMFLLMFVVPTFTESFLDAGTELPAMTRALIQFSSLLKSNLLSFLVLAIALAGAGSYFRRSERGRTYLDRWKLSFPFIGEVYRHYSTAKFSRTLATVLGGGTPLPEAVTISTDVLDNQFLKQHLKAVLKKLEQGVGFSASLAESGVFPVIALRMIDAGERGGSLARVLNDVADFYDGEVNVRLTIMTAAIEPGLMVLMGGLIGFIVLAMYLPIFQLAGNI